MPGTHSMRWLVFFVCGALAALGCSTDTQQGETGGSLSLELTVDGFKIDEVHWAITGGDKGGYERDGDINTTNSGNNGGSCDEPGDERICIHLLAVDAIPEDTNYLLTIMAISTDEELTCEGSHMFDITANEVTAIHVTVNCNKPRETGAVWVDGWFNICAQLDWAVISPLETEVGHDIDLESEASDEEDNPIRYLWESETGIGSIADPGEKVTTYTCDKVGDDFINLTVSDDDFIFCISQLTAPVPVTCTPSDGDLCDEVTCDDLGECIIHKCNPSNGMCEKELVDIGEPCDDGGTCDGEGNCNVVSICSTIECDECNACDPETGTCVPAGDSDPCGENGTCLDGDCIEVGLCDEVTCGDTGNDCTFELCNNQTGLCDVLNAPNGEACGDGGMCMSGECVQSETTLAVDKTGPPAAFTSQEFEFTVEVSNTGPDTATNVVLVDDLPVEGTFVSSDPPGSLNGDTLTVDLGDILASNSVIVTVTWQAPGNDTTLVNNAEASADNAPAAADSHEVEIGIQTAVTGGVTAAGTGLRNRDNGDITITGVPAEAVVTRAVLVWALLYTSPVPGNQITFEGEVITADLTQTISANLCWGDSATIGFATDVTHLVSGNGVYSITDPVNGVVREDSNPSPVFPVTDGASLLVFYGGTGFDDQVLSDFSYSAENMSTSTNVRNLTGINSTGGAATLYLAGPDGQGNFGEEVLVTGSGALNFDNSWEGSDPQEGPDFGIGNLWDTDAHDVSSILPNGQTTLDLNLGLGSDCTGVSAVALQVEQ